MAALSDSLPFVPVAPNDRNARVGRHSAGTVRQHGTYAELLASRPKTRGDYWSPKLASNVARDERHEHELKLMGWRVEVVWECDTRDKNRLEKSIKAICRKLL
jgi:G:T-mismatch repair DNA endonuclease (very short patch repair protein)